MSKEKQIEEMARVIHKADENCGEYFPISMSNCLSKHGRFRLNAATELYNAGYRKQSEWISVEERLPEEGETVLCYGGYCDEKYVDACMLLSEDFHTLDNYESDIIDGVTHWMPLPEPPKMKGE